MERFKSLVPWHTSHRVNLDAKGVPQEIKINVSGLPNIRNIGVDVHETTRSAWITVLYSLAFLFISSGIFLLVTALIQLVAGAHVAAVFCISAISLLLTTLSQVLTWLGWWNTVMISYIVLIEWTRHIQTCRCPYTPLKNGGKLPLCGKIWLGCLTLLGIQILQKFAWQIFGWLY